jgi:RNA polymerase sigma factor (sigma-70 family)
VQKALYHTLYLFLRQHPKPHCYLIEDWYAECLHEGWCAAKAAMDTYDPSKGTQYTYIRRAVHNRLLSYFQKEISWDRRRTLLFNQTKMEVSQSEVWNEPVDQEMAYHMEEVEDWIDVQEALSHLTEKECWLVKQVWIKKRSQAEVAKELNLSQSAISKQLKRIAHQLHQLLGWE